MPEAGVVIVLNGTSSSGKTTLAKELQKQFDDVYLHCTSDMFWDMTPYGIPANSVNFPNLKKAMAQSIRALASTGHNVIVDTVYLGGKSHQQMQETLRGITLFTVKVECDLAELKRREQARGDRRPGLAESQFHTVHNGIAYDLCVNTTNVSAQTCAEYIVMQVSG